MTSAHGRQASEVTPNRRGARSREAVLDAAERLMAEQGYEAATVAALVEEAGIPASSIYHYFGSKEGVLLAVMERGAERFFAGAAGHRPARRLAGGAPAGAGRRRRATTLERHPDFLRILVVMAAQPVDAGEGEVHRVVEPGARAGARAAAGADAARLRARPEERGRRPSRALRARRFDGAFVAHQSHPEVTLGGLLEHLPAALIAVRRDLLRR